MPIMMASESGRADGANHSWAGATSTGVAVVVDGVGSGAGCRHGMPWFVRQLGTRLLDLAGSSEASPATVLAEAVSDVAESHGPGCDTPQGAAVAMLRATGGTVEYLVSSGAVAVFDAGGEPLVVSDPEITTGTVTQVRSAVLLSRGATLLVTGFGALSWRDLLDVATGRGPAELIAATREVERHDPERTGWPRPRTHEDATVVVHQT